jgi:trans-AT polyketide synthase/acyltransferase/oxidoreductase domain-containing protein
MARGIATPRMVVEAVRAGCLGFYGSAGLSLEEIERGLHEIKAGLPDGAASWGANLIHTPNNPATKRLSSTCFYARTSNGFPPQPTCGFPRKSSATPH